MFKKIAVFALWGSLLLLLALAGCAPAPDLNRPWNTATPLAGSVVSVKAVAATPVPTAKAAAAGPAETTLLIAGAEDNPPFMYAGAGGTPAGLYPILLAGVFEQMGMKITIKTFPWTRALEMGTNGEMPLAGIYKNEERLKIFDYSDAIYPNKIMVYVQKGKSFAFASPKDLAGKNVGVMSGWTYGDEFDQAKAAGTFTIEEVASDADNLEKLALGRLDCVLAESTIADQLISEQNYGEQIEMLETPVIVFDAYLVFAKSANQTALLEKFNETMAAMRQDGSYDEMIAEWKGN